MDDTKTGSVQDSTHEPQQASSAVIIYLGKEHGKVGNLQLGISLAACCIHLLVLCPPTTLLGLSPQTREPSFSVPVYKVLDGGLPLWGHSASGRHRLRVMPRPTGLWGRVNPGGWWEASHQVQTHILNLTSLQRTVFVDISFCLKTITSRDFPIETWGPRMSKNFPDLVKTPTCSHWICWKFYFHYRFKGFVNKRNHSLHTNKTISVSYRILVVWGNLTERLRRPYK